MSTRNMRRGVRAARIYAGRVWVGLAYGSRRYILRMAKRHARTTGQPVRIVYLRFGEMRLCLAA